MSEPPTIWEIWSDWLLTRPRVAIRATKDAGTIKAGDEILGRLSGPADRPADADRPEEEGWWTVELDQPIVKRDGKRAQVAVAHEDQLRRVELN